MINELEIRLLRVGLAIYVIALIITVWTPVAPDSGALLGVIRIEGALERFLNLLLLAPLPILICKNFARLSLAILATIGPLTSITIEFIQSYIPGRTSDSIDFLLNSFGFWVALFVYFRPSKTQRH